MVRLENEAMQDYKARRKEEQATIKRKLKGKMFAFAYPSYVREKDVKRAGFTHALRNAKGYAHYLTAKYGNV